MEIIKFYDYVIIHKKKRLIISEGKALNIKSNICASNIYQIYALQIKFVRFIHEDL